MDNHPFVLIMAGGVGSRFWPASRENLPKQFLDITGIGKTLIQMTFERFAAFIPVENIYIITHDQYREQTLQAVPEINEANIITEPSRNNTAASIAFASLKLIRKKDNAVCIVAPADHIIKKEVEFKKVITSAVAHADTHGSIITLGIAPTRPDTGYGYIEYESGDRAEIRKVRSFREKPDMLTAKRYVEAGNFAWNSGLFIWKLESIIESFKKHSSQIYEVLSKGKDLYNTDEEQTFIRSQYPTTEKISVDYAILEKAENVYTIPCDIGWSDLGTWNSLYEHSDKDEHQNAVLGKTVHLQGTRASLIKSDPEKLVVIRGLEDFIIVDTQDCLLIYPKSDEQSIRQLKEILKEKGLDEYL
jgi:mannose-1-phosphate guanylyltransferase